MKKNKKILCEINLKKIEKMSYLKMEMRKNVFFDFKIIEFIILQTYTYIV